MSVLSDLPDRCGRFWRGAICEWHVPCRTCTLTECTPTHLCSTCSARNEAHCPVCFQVGERAQEFCVFSRIRLISFCCRDECDASLEQRRKPLRCFLTARTTAAASGCAYRSDTSSVGSRPVCFLRLSHSVSFLLGAAGPAVCVNRLDAVEGHVKVDHALGCCISCRLPTRLEWIQPLAVRD